jgi:hypothetical protein
MTIKASGRAAFVFAAGLWICAAGPSQAADDTDSAATPVVKQSSHLKTDAHRKSSPQAEKSSSGRKTAAAANSDDSPAIPSSQLPPSVANANAQLMTDTAASKKARAMTARANNIVQTAADTTSAAQPAPDAPVVASDQLNDVDRALAPPVVQQADAAAAPVEAQQAPPANPPVVVAASAGSAGNSTWDETSLIGKIFIGFGTLLTLASAARMFIA